MPLTSLRATLGGMSAIAVVLVASVTLSIALTTSIDAIRALGERHAAVLLSVADDATLKIFAVGTDTVDQVETLARSRDWAWPSDDDRVLTTFQGAITARFATRADVLTAVNVYFSDNSFTNVVRYNESIYETITQRVSPHATTFPDTQILNKTGFFNQLPDHRPLGYLPSEQSSFLVRNDTLWSTLATATYNGYGTGITPPYAFLSNSGEAFDYITMIAPLYRYGVPQSARRPEATLGFVLATIQFDRFLHRVRSTPNTAAFAIDRGGNLLGASTDASIHTRTLVRDWSGPLRVGCSSTADFATSGVDFGAQNHQVVCRLHVRDYPNPTLNAVAAKHPELLRRPLDSPVVTQLPLDSGRVYAASAQVQMVYRGLEVHLLLLMPEADVIGDVITGRNAAIVITCVLVVLAAGANVLVVWLLLAPLGGIAERMVRAANLEDDAEDTSVSSMAEVAELQQAYYAMNDELNRIRSYVPQSVLVAKKAALCSEEDEDDEEELETSLAPPSEQDDLATSKTPKRLSRLGSIQIGSTHETPRRSGPGSVAVRSPAAATAVGGSAAPVGLSHRTVSIVVANLRGLHAFATASAPDAIAAELAAAVAAAERAVTPRHGVVTFHGDRFFGAFNAARVCAGHAVKAAAAAAELAHAEAPEYALAFTAGVATGPCLVGPVGSATLKTHSVIGAAVSDAAALERLASEHGSGGSIDGERCAAGAALATFRTASEARSTVPLRFVDLVALPGRDGAPRAIAVAALLPAAAAEAAQAGSQPEDGEWMYVAAHAERTAGPYDACFEALQRGDAAGCLAAFAAIEAQQQQQQQQQQGVSDGDHVRVRHRRQRAGSPAPRRAGARAAALRGVRPRGCAFRRSYALPSSRVGVTSVCCVLPLAVIASPPPPLHAGSTHPRPPFKCTRPRK